MKRVRVLLCAVAALLAAGCAAVQCKPDTAAEMMRYDLSVQPIVLGADVATSRAFLSPPGAALSGSAPGNYTATILKKWYDESTPNWFAYAFGDKQIFVDAKYYPLFQRVSVGAAEASKRATTCTDANACLWAQRFALSIQDVDMMRLGTKPQ